MGVFYYIVAPCEILFGLKAAKTTFSSIEVIVGTTEINGFQISFINNNASGPAVLCLHGNSLGKEVFSGLLNSFKGANIWAIDLPGCGDSTNTDFSLASTKSIIIEFCRINKIERPLLLGVSLGGHFALQLAKGLHISGLLTIGTTPLKRPMNREEAISDLEKMPLLSSPLPYTDEERSIFAKLCTSNLKGQEQVMMLLKKAKPEFRTNIFISYQEERFESEVELLSELTCPIVLAYGENDTFINQEYLRSLDANTVKISGADHLALYSNPEKVEEILSSLLSLISTS